MSEASPDLLRVVEKGGVCFIGILDIFGFEVFDENSLEQLLINYANDKLQYFFTQTAISLVMAQYREENIDTSAILSHFNDVSPTLELLEGRPLEAPPAPTKSTAMSCFENPYDE